LIEKRPKSIDYFGHADPWVRRARFAAGAALARKGDFRAAELIYREQAKSLLSDDRRQEMTDIFLEFADAFFDPPEEDQEPDYEKALEFYLKALELGPKPEKRIEIELLVARCRQKTGDTDEAAKLLDKFVKEHADVPQVVEAQFRLGECLMEEDKPRQARRAWQDLLALHPGSSSKWIPEAVFRLSRTWGIPDPETHEQLNLGVAALQDFLERFPTHKLASQAHLDIARSYIHCGRHEDAAERLESLLADERYQDRNEIPKARVSLGLSYQSQKKFAEAVATWREYLAKHPTDAQWSEVQRHVVDTEYTMGLEKYKSEEFDAARKLLGEFLAKYPLDGRNPGNIFLFGQMNYEQKKWDAAIGDWRRLVSKHPQTNESSYAQYMIALVTEQELGKPADGSRRVPKGHLG